MLRKDYFMRQLTDFTRALFSFLLHKRGTVKEEKETLDQAYNFLGLTGLDFKNASVDELISRFREDELCLEKLELLALLLLEEYKLSENTNTDKHLLESAKTILYYVDDHSDSYSIERKTLLETIATKHF